MYSEVVIQVLQLCLISSHILLNYFYFNLFSLFIQWLRPSEGGLLEPENPLEKTFFIKQQSILHEVDVLSSTKAFDMKLPGPN